MIHAENSRNPSVCTGRTVPEVQTFLSIGGFSDTHDADRIRRGHSAKPIAGLNEFTIGFGSTLLGAAVAYWQGLGNPACSAQGNESPRGKPCGDLIPTKASGACVSTLRLVRHRLRANPRPLGGRDGLLRETRLASYH
jgi:hypothetical protein